MTDKQREALMALCARYKVEFDEHKFSPQFDLPGNWVAGWIGEHIIYVGCSPEGDIHS